MSNPHLNRLYGDDIILFIIYLLKLVQNFKRMAKKVNKPYFHIAYWIFVLLVLTKTFGFSWGNKTAAFFFVSLMLPIVMGASYFFNYFLVPRLLLTKRYVKFVFFTFCTAVVSLYLEIMVLLYSYIFLVNMNYQDLNPSAVQVSSLAAVLYLLVFIGSFFLMINQLTENRQLIKNLKDEKEKMKIPVLEIMSNRKMIKIPYSDINFIESLSDHINIITTQGDIVSKERISLLSERLPDVFLRIHRSFIINTDKIKERSSEDVLIGDIRLNIGRSYRKEVKDHLSTML